MKYYILQRNNPQFDKPYFVSKGKRKKLDILRLCNNCLYGSYSVHGSYSTEAEYNREIADLKEKGFRVS